MKLLLVDDEIYAIQGLLKMIQKEALGIECIFTANSYSQAMNVFLNEQVDILLCDIEMPYGTGFDLVEWVNENYPKTVCVFLTCHDEFDFARHAVKLNCFDYILKPVSPDIINHVIERAIKKCEELMQEEVYCKYGKVYFSSISGGEKEYGEQKDVVEKVEEYILMHIEEDLSVPKLAEQAYISVTHLNRLFRAKKNMTVNDYITDTRMKIAKKLLETTELSVAAISSKTGYGNYSYFIKIFKKTYGVTPREFREKCKHN